jgi:hypothetical protein
VLDCGHKHEQRRQARARYRARIKRCAAVAPVEYDAQALDNLIALGYLAERHAGDRRLVGEAISSLLRRIIRDGSRR